MRYHTYHQEATVELAASAERIRQAAWTLNFDDSLVHPPIVEPEVPGKHLGRTRLRSRTGRMEVEVDLEQVSRDRAILRYTWFAGDRPVLRAVLEETLEEKASSHVFRRAADIEPISLGMAITMRVGAGRRTRAIPGVALDTLSRELGLASRAEGPAGPNPIEPSAPRSPPRASGLARVRDLTAWEANRPFVLFALALAVGASADVALSGGLGFARYSTPILALVVLPSSGLLAFLADRRHLRSTELLRIRVDPDGLSLQTRAGARNVAWSQVSFLTLVQIDGLYKVRLAPSRDSPPALLFMTESQTRALVLDPLCPPVRFRPSIVRTLRLDPAKFDALAPLPGP